MLWTECFFLCQEYQHKNEKKTKTALYTFSDSITALFYSPFHHSNLVGSCVYACSVVLCTLSSGISIYSVFIHIMDS